MKIEIKNLNKSYDFDVFNNFNIVFDSNLTHLIGANGTGKSTLLKILAGKICFESGEIYIDSELVNVNYLANNTVLIDQDINLFINDTVKKNIVKIVGMKYDKTLIKKFGFNDMLNKKVYKLSGGFKKKLMLMIAFMLKPQILLLDEYSSYIDFDSLKLIDNMIKEYSKEHLVIYVDHNDTLNGKEKKIEENDFFEVKKTSKYKKNNYSFKYRSSFFSIFNFIILMIFLVATQISFSFANINGVDIIANYLDSNDLWFQPAYIESDLDYPKYYYYPVETESNFLTCITNDDFPILINSDLEAPNVCYVFSNMNEYFEKNVRIDGKKYLVKGIIDLDVEKYLNTPYEYYIKVFVIKDETVPNNVQDTFINAKNNAGKLYKEHKIMHFYDDWYYTPYDDLYKIIIVFTIVFFSISIVTMALKNKKENDVLSSYKASRLKLFFDSIITNIINFIVIGLLSYFISYYSLFLIYQKMCPQYNVIFMRPFECIVIGLIIYLLLYFFSLYYLGIRKRKSISIE